MASCEFCGDQYSPRQKGQRFCSEACSNGFHAWERREALKPFRAAQTYHEREAEALGPGGRFAALEPRLTELPAPSWAFDPSGIEPPVDGRGEGSVLAYGIHGDDHDPA